MTTKSHFLALCLGLPFFAQAQGGGAGFFHVGYARVFDVPVSEFLPQGFPASQEQFVTVGGSGYMLVKRLMIGGEGHGSIGHEFSQDTLTATRSFGQGFFNLGVAAINKPNLKLIPFLGIGSITQVLNLRDNRNLDFGAYQSDIGPREIEFEITHFALSLNLGLDYVLGKKKDSGWMVGLRAGYLLGFSSQSWEVSGEDLVNAPSVMPHGFRVQLVIGGGGFGEKTPN